MTEDFANSELFPTSFHVLRCDRNLSIIGGTRGGGALLAFSNALSCEKLDLHCITECVPTIDIVGAKISYSPNTKLIILVAYIPPATEFASYELFFELLSHLPFIYDNHVILLGDFNVPEYNTDHQNDKRAMLIKNYEQLFNFTQYNYVTNSIGRVLDLVLSNIDNCSVTKEFPLIKEDNYHPSLSVQLTIQADKYNNFQSNAIHKKYNFKKANFPRLYELLIQTDWTFLNKFSEINAACQALL